MTTTTNRTRKTKADKPTFPDRALRQASTAAGPPPDFVPAKTPRTPTEPAWMSDSRLLVTDSDEAREQMRLRVEHRRSFDLPLCGLAWNPSDYEAAPDATILLLDDLGVVLAAAERRRRGL